MANQISKSEYGWDVGPLSLIPTPLYLSGSTDSYTHAATEKALSHNALIRAFNSIYVQAPHIPPNLYTSFVSYSLAIHQCLNAHHTGEEDFLFPEIQRLTGDTGIMNDFVSQHASYHTGAKVWGKWLQSILERRNSFSPDMNRSLMDDFLPALHARFSEEILALLALSQFGERLNMQQLVKKEGKRVRETLNKTTQMPAILCNHDKTYERGIHNIPPTTKLTKRLLRHWYVRKKKEWWRFASCGIDGQPRRLEFIG